MMDMMLCAAALLLCAAVLYGFRAILLWLAGMLTAIACEAAMQPPDPNPLYGRRRLCCGHRHPDCVALPGERSLQPSGARQRFCHCGYENALRPGA